MCAINEILTKAIDAFWDGKDQNGKTLSFTTDEGKKEAICRAFKDLTVRTMSKKIKMIRLILKSCRRLLVSMSLNMLMEKFAKVL